MRILIFLLNVIFFSDLLAADLETAPKKWPCDQVYNYKLNLEALWQGPDVSKNIKNWWKDDEVIDVVSKLSNPILTESDGIKIIEEFAKEYSYFGLIPKDTQKEKLLNTFAGLYQKASDKRRRQYEGIVKFVDRQDKIRKTIGTASKKLRELKKQGFNEKNQEVIKFSSQMKWNTRVFDQRTKLTEFICEEPVLLEQRIGYQSRKIQSIITR